MTRAFISRSHNAARFLAILGVLCGLLAMGGRVTLAQAIFSSTLEASGPVEPKSLYLPVVTRDNVPPTDRLCRFGIGAPSGNEISRYPVNALRLGWYIDWGAAQNPVRPGGIEYLQMIRLHQTGSDSYTSVPQGSDLLAMIATNLGALWVIGNEPDRRLWQDDIVPAVYAQAYHDLYHQIKAADPTARIVAGSIVQPTPLRLQYLDLILDNYRARYGQQMPVDVWNIHAFILNERSCTYIPEDCWGADVPPGINAHEGMRYGIQDNDNLEVFKRFIVDFRQWMADRGYKERPLIITEYGVLMPQEYGFSPARVNAYMNATFNYLMTATGPTGYSADKGRLVQAWAWYSLTDRTFNGWLFEAQTRARTAYGDNFAAYTSTIAPVVNLTPGQLWVEPVVGARPDQAVKLVAQVANNGHVAMSQAAHVRFYAGYPAHGGVLIGSDQILPVINGCGNTAQAVVTWNNAPLGASTVWVVVDPLNVITESDESDNQLSTVITVGS